MLAELAAARAALAVALDDLEQLILRGGHAERFKRPRQRPLHVRRGGAQGMHRMRGGRRRGRTGRIGGYLLNSGHGGHG